MTNGMRGIVFAAVVALATTVAGQASAIDWGKGELDTETIAVKLTKETIKGGYGIVKTEELKKWVAEKRPMLIVDTMPFEDSYKKEHIPGAVQFELPIEEMADMKQEQQAALSKLLGDDKGRLVVFYCGFTKCGRSHNGAMWAKKLGYTNVWRHPGGIKAWSQADGPVEKAQ